MKKDFHFSQKILWGSTAMMIFGMIIIGSLTNLTLRSIERNLPSTLLTELNDLSYVLENLAEAVNSAERYLTRPSIENLDLLKGKVNIVNAGIVELRESYVFDNMVKASAFHAVIAPAISDLQIWLTNGVSGYGPETEQTAKIVFLRIQKTYQKTHTLTYESKITAQKILEKQRHRLDRFLVNVNLLFILSIIITTCMVYLLYRQHMLQRREYIAQIQLRNQRDLLNSLFENILMGITVWNQAGELQLLNKSFKDITGYSFKDIETLDDWFPTAFPDPVYRKKVVAEWKALTNRKQTTREFKVTCKNDKMKDIEFRGSILPDGRSLVTLSDITDMKLKEKMIQKSREIKTRAKKMESLGLLAGGVAHDLNNILSGIVSYPDLILIDLPENSNLRKPIQTMQESGQRATAIVSDLLAVARGFATTKQPVNLNKVIRDYLVSPEYEKLKEFHDAIKIETHLDKDVLNIFGSQIHIRKVVMNLVSNAAEAIGIKGTIMISTANRHLNNPVWGYDDFNDGGYVILSVSDDGPGISKENLERIFEPFYSNKVMGRSGTGLGLAVVWNIVHDHKGYIDLRSGKNNTIFNVYFPGTKEAISDRTSHRPLEDYMGSGEKILVIDDIDSQREIVSKMLVKLGYSATAVSSGEEAVAYLKQHEADLLIIDMIMEPGINGRETYERILKIKPGQKAIITSGFSKTSEVIKAQKLGAGKYVEKPFTLENLGLEIKDELEN